MGFLPVSHSADAFVSQIKPYIFDSQESHPPASSHLEELSESVHGKTWAGMIGVQRRFTIPSTSYSFKYISSIFASCCRKEESPSCVVYRLAKAVSGCLSSCDISDSHFSIALWFPLLLDTPSSHATAVDKQILIFEDQGSLILLISMVLRLTLSPNISYHVHHSNLPSPSIDLRAVSS